MRREDLASGGAIGASLLIGWCCIAPALFLLFGVSAGGLGALTALEPYRPAFVALGLAALAYAGLRLRRGRRGECEGGACTPDAPSLRFTRKLFLTAVVLFAVATAYPYVLGAIL